MARTVANACSAFLMGCSVLFPATAAGFGTEIEVTLQPIGHVGVLPLEVLRDSLLHFDGLEGVVIRVVVAKGIDFPEVPRTTPRTRRAEFLLSRLAGSFLVESSDSVVAHSRTRKVILGVTAADIATAPRESRSFGVLGMARTPGNVAVVSLWQLQENPSPDWRAQLARVARHELAHNLGLRHCSNRQCLMSEYDGYLRNIGSARAFCAKCRMKLEQR